MRNKDLLRFPALFAGLLLTLPAAAQERPHGAGAQQQQPTVVEGEEPFSHTVEFPRDWSINEEVQRLEESMEHFNGLIDSLGRANSELSDEFERYLEDPQNEVLASDIERQMAHWAGEVVQDFDTIIADQDSLISNFGLLQRKLGRFRAYLDAKMEEYDGTMQQLREEAQAMDQELVRLAVQIREADDPQERAALQQQFTRQFRLFRLKARYLNGYERNLANYRRLTENLDLLTGVFGSLRDRFVDLIANLENERNYLIDSIRLQADSVRIKQLIAEGFTYGERSIRNVSERLVELYMRVDAFTQVHDRINMNLGSFVESQQTLLDISQRIDSIGTDGIATMPEIEDAIEFFANRRDVFSTPTEDYELPDLQGVGATRAPATPEEPAPQAPAEPDGR